MIKVRTFPESNYRAIWINHKTIRIALDPSQPITELQYPEFLDIKLTNYCNGGCKFCYMDSVPDVGHYQNVVGKINEYFGALTPEQRPFQVAIGGGEPTAHPDFIPALKAFYDLGIEPNYTTGGMFIDGQYPNTPKDIFKATKQYSGGAALSCHPHLTKYWVPAATMYIDHGIKLNFHHILSDKPSVDRFLRIYEKWQGMVDYHVLLCHMPVGRGKDIKIEWDYICEKIPQGIDDIAFGANFYPYLLQQKRDFDVSLYEPEIMSKYLDLGGSGALYNSSFASKPILTNIFKQSMS